MKKPPTARAAFRFPESTAGSYPRSMLLPRRASLGVLGRLPPGAPGKRWTLGGSESRRASNFKQVMADDAN
jgi:hypothetical protein